MLRHSLCVPVRFFAFIILFAFQLFASSAWGQTDPVAQALPYSQNFSSLTGSTTTYPAGFQGWTVPGSLTTVVLTAAPSGNQPLFAGQTNATTSPFVGDMWGKIGLMSGSVVNALCLALNTTSVASGSVQLIYTAATQGQTAGGYIDELDLQYRIGTSGTFTTIANATYRNNALTNTNAAVTTAYNPATIYVVLPAACTNQPVVELRWISRNVSGSGSVHPGFSISSVVAQQNTTTEYYSKASGSMDILATWGTNADGSGTAPANFTTDGQVFHISNGTAGILGGNWSVSGAGSKVIVDGTDFVNTASNTISATIDVNAGRTLTLQNGALPALGAISQYSTVVFSNLSGVTIPTVTPSYGSITFNNSTVIVPVANQKVHFSGDFTLQGSSAFNGADAAKGYTLAAYGNNAQVINANGRPLTIWNLDVGSTNLKTAGPVTLAPNTTITTENSVLMVLSGATPLFYDGGNTINVINNFDCGGATTAYNFTGTVSLNSSGSGSCNIRGNGVPSNPCVAAVNNLVLNNSINVKINPPTGGSTLSVKGNLIVTAAATGYFNCQDNNISVGGNFSYNNGDNSLLTMGAGELIFNGSGVQTYTSSVTGGNTLSNITMNNTGGGLALNAPMNVSGRMTLTSGVLSTGAYTLSIGAGGTVTGGNVTSYVNGNLLKVMPATGTTSMFYENGDNTYSPVLLNFSNSQNSGSINVKSTAGMHPSMATSYVNTGNFVNRYWTVTSTSVNPTTVNVSLSYSSTDITSGLGLNTGYIIREYAGGAWVTSPSVTNITSGSAPLLPFASTTVGVNGGTFSGAYVAGGLDCTTSPGSATGSPALICSSGTTVLSLDGATMNTGNTYQWQSSTDGSSWSNISGATAATYTTSVIATSIYYRSNVGCIPTATTVNSVSALVTVNPSPAAITGTISGCIGLSATLSDATGAGSWSSNNASVVSIGSSSGMYNALASGNVIITYTAASTGCIATAVLTINPTPPAPVVSPLLVSLCPSSPAQLVSASGDTATLSFTGNSGGISIPIPYNTAISSDIPVSGIPAGAIITNVMVTFSDSNSASSQGRDYVYNLGAPNGNILNLINATGGSAPNCHFRNIQVGSAGTVAQGTTQLVPGVLYIASLANTVPSTAGFTTPALKSNVTSWSSLYSTPNGNWTFIADNIYAFGAGEGTLTNWILNISYIIPPSVTWSPTTGLYTDGGASISYTGANTGSVYAKPLVTTTYNVTAAIGACTNSATVVAQLNTSLYVPPISGSSIVCFGSSITMSDSAAGGTWSSSGSASIGSASGIVIGNSVGTAVVTYTYSSGLCSGSATKIISVNPLPVVSPIAGNANLCYSGSPVVTTLSDATTGGIWSSSNTAVALIGSSSGALSGIATGSSVITYAYSNGDCAANVTATVNVYSQPGAVSVSPSFLYLCGGSAPRLLTASGGLIPGSTTVASGPISVLCSTVAPTATTLAVSGVPVGATVTGIAVTFNINCGFDGDAELNLAAPNGSVLNLFASGTSNSGVNFVNTTISSAGLTPIPNSPIGAPWTGVYAASARTNAALTKPFSTYAATTTSWAPLEAGDPNGTWSLVGLDNYRDSTFTITSWSITISYNFQSNVTWAGLGGLYTNSGGTAGYTGTVTNTVYTAPGSTTVYTVSATNGTCSSTASMTMSINPAPAPISGNLNVCLGSNTQLTDAGGGTWSTGSGNITIGSSDGLVTSVSLGTAAVTYTIASGCSVSAIVTVNAMPGSISGILQVCQGRSTSLAAGGGGIWSSSNPGNATVGSSGLVTGVTGGTTATITYTLAGGCFVTVVVTVNIAPSVITGTRAVCIGSTNCLSDAVAGGTWSSNNGNVSVGTTGCISGVTAGTSIITYRLPTGCIATAITTANVTPGSISGTLVTCQGTTTQLSDAGAGTWSSSNTSTATVTVGTGLVSGVGGGTSTISFSFSSGCAAVAVVTINALPAPINGALSICLGSVNQLTDTDAGGTWGSSNGNVTIGSAGAATGVTTGTSTITYTLATNCAITTIATVNPNPGSINGLLTVCEGATVQLTDADGGGTWTSNNSSNATVSSSGLVTGIAGNTTATITYALPTTCSSTTVVTVNPSPAAISGTLSICQGGATQLTDATGGGAWSTSSSNVAVGSAGLVSGTSAGTAAISYFLSGGCAATVVVTVNANPGSINGTLTVCEGSTTQLTDVGSGTWESSNPGNAPVSASGSVSGISGNTTTTITYTLPTGCSSTAVVTVNPLPNVIVGTLTVCEGATTQLTDAGGGSWNTGSSNASVNSTGVVAGLTGGTTATITYVLPTGCTAMATVTINPLPAPISGAGAVCVGSSIALSSDGGGTWSGGNAIASVDGSGNVTGLSSGTTAVTYGLSTGCSVTTIIVVNPIPDAISGADNVCEGSSVTLSAAGLGTWTGSNGNVFVDASGIVTGITAGTSVITYTSPVGGCFTTRAVTVNALPSPILGTASVSVGYTTTLSDSGDGNWLISNSNATIDATGLVTGVAVGTSIVTYTLATGCSTTTTLTIVATLPAITGAMTVCAGSVTALSDLGTGTWSSSNSNATVGSGTGVVTGVSAGTSIITFSFSGGGEVYTTVTVNPLPLGITGPSSVCEGEIITLSDASPGGNWSSTANASAGTSGVVTGIAAGTATISYMVSPTQCYVVKVITINALPGLITGTTNVCVGSTTHLSDATVGGTWSSSNANASVGTSGIVAGVSAGSVSISYALATGCYTTWSMNVDPLPGAISGTTNICEGHTVTLSDVGSGSWSSSNTNASVDEETGLVTGVSAGTSTITYALSTGCIMTTIVTVNSTAVPSIVISTATGDTICAGIPVAFTTTTSNGGSAPVYQWSVNGGIITGATNSTYNFTPSNGDTITVRLTSNAVCASPGTTEDSDVMTVINSDTSSVHISATPGDTVCQGSYAIFTALGVNGGTAPEYLWFINGIQAGTGGVYGYTPAANDNIYCELVSSLQCVVSDTVASNNIVMQIDTAYVPFVLLTAMPGTVIGPLQSDTFTAVVSNAGPSVSYQWFINDMPMPGATSAMFIASNFSNNDSVSCAVVAAGACGYASFNAVKIRIIYTEVPQVTQGVHNIRLIPNPNNGQFLIRGSLVAKDDAAVVVEITDIIGHVVYQNVARSNGGKIDEAVSLNGGMANGMYQLNLRTGSENIVIHFVIGR